MMICERDDFSLTGPLHLTAIDWANEHHRRSVAASLVQGIYVAERDRQLQREGPDLALSPIWSEFFHFRLIRKLVDDADISIFGGIYEYKPPQQLSQTVKSVELSPRFVIAFRGTVTKADSISRDIELDFHVIRNGLHTTTRFEIAIQAVRNIIASVGGGSNVWLAGHSLGASMALLIGKTTARTGVLPECFAFNPPFLSAPIERIKDKRIKHGIRIAGSVITAGLALAKKATQQYSQNNRALPAIPDPFASLSDWFPRLYVNPGDHLCSEYIGYFEHRNKMEEIGIGFVERVATQHSLGGILLGGQDPVHLMPSSVLTVNLSSSRDFKQAHGIHQWWKEDHKFDTKVYQYK
ncbi:hypothetical protein CARUB_v10001294mg [Capsella rubella]|uniref:Fungal lipase-type domain-containing protein n=1 Tax=Capsella rubella TaxID=81985 RepID=R0H7X4_9BRAS|nr:GDSL esterase/lipase At4g10955 [Capsella rubella]XP_023637479.1 GDSL esterase/lipase At4g10955 [Capsella rubella]EOA20960.1 hypothetical protein CARUB_v10001294mg [Capsella rubella]